MSGVFLYMKYIHIYYYYYKPPPVLSFAFFSIIYYLSSIYLFTTCNNKVIMRDCTNTTHPLPHLLGPTWHNLTKQTAPPLSYHTIQNRLFPPLFCHTIHTTQTDCFLRSLSSIHNKHKTDCFPPLSYSHHPRRPIPPQTLRGHITSSGQYPSNLTFSSPNTPRL